MQKALIRSVGMYVPPNVVSNDDLARKMDTSDEWIFKRTGIRNRHWVDFESDMGSSQMGLLASIDCIEQSGIDPKQIDALIFATLSPDCEFPGTGCFLQAKLEQRYGIGSIPAFDLRQQCCGFLYSLAVADQFIQTNFFQNVLIVGAETHSRGLNQTTQGREVSVLFGDGAGAALISKANFGENQSRILAHSLHSEGKHAKQLWIPRPGYAQPGERIKASDLELGLQYPVMNGKVVFTHAVEKMQSVLIESINKANVSLDQIDLFIFHQANLRINDMVAKNCSIPSFKVFNTIENYGNTTAATIPIGLYEAQKAKVLKKGDLVATAAFGSGFTWASSVFIW